MVPKTNRSKIAPCQNWKHIYYKFWLGLEQFRQLASSVWTTGDDESQNEKMGETRLRVMTTIVRQFPETRKHPPFPFPEECMPERVITQKTTFRDGPILLVTKNPRNRLFRESVLSGNKNSGTWSIQAIGYPLYGLPGNSSPGNVIQSMTKTRLDIYEDFFIGKNFENWEKYIAVR